MRPRDSMRGFICLSVHWSAANHFAAEDASLASFFPLPQFFQMRPCISLRGSVCQYIGPSVGWLVHRLVGWSIGQLVHSIGRSVGRSFSQLVHRSVLWLVGPLKRFYAEDASYWLFFPHPLYRWGLSKVRFALLFFLSIHSRIKTSPCFFSPQNKTTELPVKCIFSLFWLFFLELPFTYFSHGIKQLRKSSENRKCFFIYINNWLFLSL